MASVDQQLADASCESIETISKRLGKKNSGDNTIYLSAVFLFGIALLVSKIDEVGKKIIEAIGYIET
jgi:hypothetical protein